jgi:hypothetical protein
MTNKAADVGLGKINANHYAIKSGEALTDLGKEVIIVPFTWRPTALDLSKEGKIVSSHEQNSELFQDIQKRSFGADSGCLFGPEYLVWVPSQRSFCTLLFGSKSHRNVAKVFNGFLPQNGQLQSVILKSKPAQKDKFVWQVMDPFLYPNGIAAEDLPSPEELQDALNKFLNPPKADQVEVANGTPADR